MGPPKAIEVRLDADRTAIARGYVEAGERCEIAGIGPIPVTIRVACSTTPASRSWAAQGGEVTRSPHRIGPSPQTPPLARSPYPVCGVEGCDCSERLEIDHVIPVEAHGPGDEINCWRISPTTTNSRPTTAGKSKDPSAHAGCVPPDEPHPP